MRRRAKPPKVKGQGMRPPPRKSPKTDDARVRDLEKRLAEALKGEAEALEQRTATSEILRLIADSPADLPTVLNGILGGAIRLVGAEWGAMARFDGEVFHLVAQQGATPGFLETAAKVYPFAPHPDSPSTRAITERHPVYIEDAFEASYRGTRELARAAPYRSLLSLPLLREGRGIGTINLTWPDVRPFPADRIELLKTFADQAVIAIENVRLFTELEARNRALTEALEQQTATSEILRVISSSPTDVQPTFDAIAASARSLCEAAHGMVFRFDGELIHLAAHDNLGPDQLDAIRSVFPIPPGRGSVTARAILTRALVHVGDRREDPELEYSILSANFPNTLSVPLLREGVPLGAITVTRAEIGLFSDRQIALLQTFADQAVIAIENVRLFRELQARTAELTRSVGELKALGEVGQAVSSTLDLETVLSTIVSRANDLAGMDGGAVYEYDEGREEFSLRATDRLSKELVEVLRGAHIRKGEGAVGGLAVTGETVVVRDISGKAVTRARFGRSSCGWATGQRSRCRCCGRTISWAAWSWSGKARGSSPRR